MPLGTQCLEVIFASLLQDNINTGTTPPGWRCPESEIINRSWVPRDSNKKQLLHWQEWAAIANDRHALSSESSGSPLKEVKKFDCYWSLILLWVTSALSEHLLNNWLIHTRMHADTHPIWLLEYSLDSKCTYKWVYIHIRFSGLHASVQWFHLTSIVNTANLSYNFSTFWMCSLVYGTTYSQSWMLIFIMQSLRAIFTVADGGGCPPERLVYACKSAYYHSTAQWFPKWALRSRWPVGGEGR
jgi:hypothetical protein